jgi:hypothetical protein
MSDLKNDAFERLLIEACKQHLKHRIESYQYSTIVLNQLWNSDLQLYSDSDCNTYYYEISMHDTQSGLPIIVSLPK